MVRIRGVAGSRGAKSNSWLIIITGKRMICQPICQPRYCCKQWPSQNGPSNHTRVVTVAVAGYLMLDDAEANILRFTNIKLVL